MKKTKWLYILTIFCLSMILLVGCGEKKDDPVAPIEPILLASGGTTEYVILRGNDASKAVLTAASSLWETFNEKTGANIDLCDEFRYEEKGKPSAIVVGITSDEISGSLKSDLRSEDFVIRAEGKNLYLVGGSDEATVNAVNWFIENYLNESVDTLQLAGDFEMRHDNDYAVHSLSIAGTDVSAYRIVYDADLYYSKACAVNLRDLIVKTCGVRLQMIPDTEPVAEYEILVGSTDREQSVAAIDSFAEPHRNWSVSVSGAKLVVANKGVRAGDEAVKAFEKWLGKLDQKECDLTASSIALSGDVLSTDKRAIPRSDGTDIRVMQSNVEGTLGDKANGYTNQQRAELLVDTYLVYEPDVITFNELYITTNRELVVNLKRLLAPYYEFVDAEWLGLYSDSEATSYGQPIAYRKDAGLTVLDAGFNYLSDLVDYHGASWAVFETEEGNRFLTVAAHLSKNEDSNGNESAQWVENVLEIVELAKVKYGQLPIVMGGDWFFAQGNYYSTAYNAVIANGYEDVSETAVQKHSAGKGTSHDIGVGTQNGAEIDIFFITPEWFNALSHKIVIDFYTVNSSDHYPVVADLQFAKSATSDDIPNAFDGKLDIEDEGTVGSGSWQSAVQ